MSEAHGSCWKGQGHSTGCECSAWNHPLPAENWKRKAQPCLARLDRSFVWSVKLSAELLRRKTLQSFIYYSVLHWFIAKLLANSSETHKGLSSPSGPFCWYCWRQGMSCYLWALNPRNALLWDAPVFDPTGKQFSVSWESFISLLPFHCGCTSTCVGSFMSGGKGCVLIFHFPQELEGDWRFFLECSLLLNQHA